jgi:hypothetical protein
MSCSCTRIVPPGPETLLGYLSKRYATKQAENPVESGPKSLKIAGILRRT